MSRETEMMGVKDGSSWEDGGLYTLAHCSNYGSGQLSFRHCDFPSRAKLIPCLGGVGKLTAKRTNGRRSCRASIAVLTQITLICCSLMNCT